MNFFKSLILAALTTLTINTSYAADSKSMLPQGMELELTSSAPILAPLALVTWGEGLDHVADSPWSVVGLNLGVNIKDFVIRGGVGTFPFMWTINTAAAAEIKFGGGKGNMSISPFAGVSYNYVNKYQKLSQNDDYTYELEEASYAFSAGYFVGARITLPTDVSWSFGIRHDPILYKSERETSNLGFLTTQERKGYQTRDPRFAEWGVFGCVGLIFY